VINTISMFSFLTTRIAEWCTKSSIRSYAWDWCAMFLASSIAESSIDSWIKVLKA
jgi:hypothetical protein